MRPNDENNDAAPSNSEYAHGERFVNEANFPPTQSDPLSMNKKVNVCHDDDTLSLRMCMRPNDENNDAAPSNSKYAHGERFVAFAEAIFPPNHPQPPPLSMNKNGNVGHNDGSLSLPMHMCPNNEENDDAALSNSEYAHGERFVASAEAKFPPIHPQPPPLSMNNEN
eukprot:12276729-Ditylum_brightwellii.AAC.1